MSWPQGKARKPVLADDADQLDLICNLKVELDKGNAFAGEWLKSAVKRLRSPWAKDLAQVILHTVTTAGGTAGWTKTGGSTAESRE